jgi:potassium channel subfamily K
MDLPSSEFTMFITKQVPCSFSLEGIYFTIVTFLTVGFGDFYPTKPSTKVLVFPLGLLGTYNFDFNSSILIPIQGITLLANCITMIVSFFSKHQKKHKAQVRAEREKEWQVGCSSA